MSWELRTEKLIFRFIEWGLRIFKYCPARLFYVFSTCYEALQVICHLRSTRVTVSCLVSNGHLNIRLETLGLLLFCFVSVTEKVNEEVSTDASESEDVIPSKPEPKTQPKKSPQKVREFSDRLGIGKRFRTQFSWPPKYRFPGRDSVCNVNL